jgi:hypothetical protein
MVKERADYPVIEWRDFPWNKELCSTGSFLEVLTVKPE